MSGDRRRRPTPPLNPAITFDGQTCLLCGFPAKAFDAETVPELLDYIRGAISLETLSLNVRRRAVPHNQCAVAPKSGVSVCKDKERTR